MSKENWVTTAALSFLVTTLSKPLSSLHHKACPDPATNSYLQPRWSPRHNARGQGHKKIRDQGQGPSSRGQTLSRPITGVLEAEDQGHKAQALSKRKGLQNSFASDLQKRKRSSKFF